MKVRWALGLYAAGLCLLVALGGWSSSRSTELVSGGGALEDASGAKASMLRSDLSALEGATAAEARAAARERKVGSAKLQLARQASHDATSFMRKAQTLLTSEEALKQQQV